MWTHYHHLLIRKPKYMWLFMGSKLLYGRGPKPYTQNILRHRCIYQFLGRSGGNCPLSLGSAIVHLHKLIRGAFCFIGLNDVGQMPQIFLFYIRHCQAMVILSRYCKVINGAKLFKGLHASLLPYDGNVHVMQAFCECWCPAANTLYTFMGEISLTFWVLHMIGGFSIWGSFYDEVVPGAKEMLSFP